MAVTSFQGLIHVLEGHLETARSVRPVAPAHVPGVLPKDANIFLEEVVEPAMTEIADALQREGHRLEQVRRTLTGDHLLVQYELRFMGRGRGLTFWFTGGYPMGLALHISRTGTHPNTFQDGRHLRFELPATMDTGSFLQAIGKGVGAAVQVAA